MTPASVQRSARGAIALAFAVACTSAGSTAHAEPAAAPALKLEGAFARPQVLGLAEIEGCAPSSADATPGRAAPDARTPRIAARDVVPTR